MQQEVMVGISKTDGSLSFELMDINGIDAVNLIQKVVGGFFEHVRLEIDLSLYCNDIGLVENMPVNKLASSYYGWGEFGIRGDVIFIGPPDGEGGVTGLSASKARELGIRLAELGA